ncbi:probable multidrug resistance-associated protein lethal(2)03659 [Musca domestica]|uniref:Probable multidrug resistance-associated protein lethal(2)03659 isoform X1 n=1 Tax=Musca domestica TaxID=7370 RepID=A0A1I8MQY1_MUSDO|nr:probable multidrug resistance-associated protein lethal(2)03659 [Musca domestica]
MQSFKSDELPENPRESSNPLSAMMFCFTMPTFFKGRKRVLDESDLFRALKEHKSDLMGHKLSHAWEEELAKSRRKGKEPSLIRATIRVFGLHYMMLGILMFLFEVFLRCSQPLFLGALVSYYADPETDKTDQTTAFLYALGVILTSAGSVFLMHPNMLGIVHTGMKVRVAICSMIYRKALRLSKSAMVNTTSGQMVNLISNDVGRLDTSVLHMHFIWIGPLEIFLVTYFIYQEIGASSLIGVAVMLLFVPIQGYMGKKTSVLRLRTALCTDERVRLMNEIISGIQVIKMYAWEIPFGKMVDYARRKEMKAIRYVNYIRGIMGSFIMFISRISIFSSLVGYVLLGHFLTAEKAFVVTAFYGLLRITMTVYFPMAVAQVAETLVSFRRIQKFMLLDEVKMSENPIVKSKMIPAIVSENDKSVEIIKTNVVKEPGIVIQNLTAKWNPESAEYNLDNVTLEFKPKQLIAVIGPVGAGKSTLIQTILGELQPSSGSITVNGTVSYASQEPWLFTGTVRQNILFGQPMDKKRYNLTVKKCALERDFELLPYGDKTIVGERGASLSGGQKARINLARAVYRQADIYLLDDPLSAVDTHVGRHLFDQCMRQYLRDRTVVLVTHQLQFLEQADVIVILDKGQVRAVGTYESMRQSGFDYAQLLLSNGDDEEQQNEVLDKSDGRIDNDRDAQKMKRQNSRQRQISVTSVASTVESVQEVAPKQVEESREQGEIGWKLYAKYFSSGGSYITLAIMVILCVGAQAFGSGGDYFLSYWVNKNENKAHEVEARAEIQTDPVDIYIFSAINVAIVIVAMLRSFMFFNLASKSSTRLHNDMFVSVTRTSMYFFNTNPSGRILNRFSKDMGQVDEILPQVMMDVIQIFLALLGIVIVLAIVNPWYILATVIMFVIFYFLRSFYLKTSRDVKRLEAITRSPIYTHLGASLNGLATIRAFEAQDILIHEFDNYQDMHSSGYYMFLTTSRAFGYWLDCCCVLYLAIITLSFLLFSPENGGDVGLAITQAMGLTGMVQWGMRQSAEMENTMTSVERVVEYESIKPEGELESEPNKKPPKSWPEEGKITFDNLSLRYAPDPKSEYVLKSLNFNIQPCDKVGIVGRTGAGKSSLINALFRLSFNDGSIVIDKRDTQDMGLHDLRSKISIIPQEPVLFSGTMRYNLDPFDEYSDAKLWEALEEVKLKQVVADMPNGLHAKISEGGTNFSVGQRQLVCLARAILRENRILVMDEATANVDPQTDALIQTTIRHKFQNCTVLTIAHRLHTVMDSDKVLVMDAGRAVEFGSPYELLNESKVGIFLGMVKQTGQATFENLFQVAQKAYENNLQGKKDQ